MAIKFCRENPTKEKQECTDKSAIEKQTLRLLSPGHFNETCTVMRVMDNVPTSGKASMYRHSYSHHYTEKVVFCSHISVLVCFFI